jgi:N-sulfoglucosamine sulfohydrolase
VENNMKKNSVILLVLMCTAIIAPCTAQTPPRPNFIFFITDDISAEDLGCYGNRVVKTPHLDRMASEGLVFDNAFLTISSCSPSRCSIITGRYPHNTGAGELHTTLPADQYLFPLSLKQAGYYTVLSGKHHMGKNADKAFTRISKGKGPGQEGDWVELLQKRPKDQPFFFWFASTDAHRDWKINSDAPVYQPDTVTVPPYLYNGPVTRKDLADYYHEVSRTDTYLGKLRTELERQGIADTTYVIYCSDNGRPFPRCKTRLYDDGIQTPLIICNPSQIKSARTDSLVSSIDFGPTILELAGVTSDPRIQGVSFTKILKTPQAKTRDYVFAEHNWHVFAAHERMVRTKKWLYIRNARPEQQNLCMESTGHFPAGTELWDAHAQGKTNKNQQNIFQKPRAAEELFDVVKDPDQLNNLISSASHEATADQLRHVLNKWIKETGDTIPENPTNDREDIHRKRYRNHKRGTMPGTETDATHINHPGPVLKRN